MALIDHFDRRALVLACVPIALFLVIAIRCLLPPAPDAWASARFLGILLLSYGPLLWLALFRAWGDIDPPPAVVAARARRLSLRGLWVSRPTRLGSAWQAHVVYDAFTIWIAKLHWSLVSDSKEALEQPKPTAPFTLDDYLRLGREVPTGLGVFGDDLVVMGIVLPLLGVGILWVILPSRP
jgi:hypothetical protein